MVRLSRKRFLHLVVLPSVLIVSDLFIGFMGHFSGSTGNQFTWEAFGEYITHLTFADIGPTLVIAFVVILIVEGIIRHG